MKNIYYHFPVNVEDFVRHAEQSVAAAVEGSEIRPGMVVVIQTFSDNLGWNPHLHALVL